MKLFGNFQKRESLQKGTAQMEAASRFEIAMFQPDQAGNVGAAARLTACMGLGLHVIEPCGFPLDDQRIRRAGMDYLDFATIRRHVDWRAFQRAMTVPVAAMPRRLVLLSTQATCRYDRFAFQPGDVLLLGGESSGVPPQIHAEAHERIRIPTRMHARSLNVVVAAAMVAGHAASATGLFDDIERDRAT